mgnify:CR=1 FL=1
MSDEIKQPTVKRPDTMALAWLKLKRMIGKETTPLQNQEGQLRYLRDGAVDGKLWLARRLSTGVFEWWDFIGGHPTIFAYQTKSTGFTALSTTLTTMDSVEIGPGVSGVVYDIECNVHSRLSIDATGFARIYARIAGDASVIGEQTGTIAGERSCNATATKLAVTGDGSTTYTLYARADMDAGAGTCASTHIHGRMVPRS